MVLMASHLFARLLRTTNQFTCFCIMAYLTRGTQANITKKTTAKQMWIWWRKHKIAWDYEVLDHVVSNRHHTRREYHSAQLWCFMNKLHRPWKIAPTIRIIGASDQDQFPFAVHSLRPSLSGMVHTDFWYIHFLSWNILFNMLSGLTRFCNQTIYFLLITRNDTQYTS